MNPIKEAIEALEGLDEAYCRAGAPLSRDERAEDRKRLIKARAALAALRSMPEAVPVAQVVPHEATVRLEWASVEAAHNAKLGPLFATPPPATVQLSEAEIDAVYREVWSTVTHAKRLSAFARAIERAVIGRVGEKTP